MPLTCVSEIYEYKCTVYVQVINFEWEPLARYLPVLANDIFAYCNAWREARASELNRIFC